jgi:hypothetical protein
MKLSVLLLLMSSVLACVPTKALRDDFPQVCSHMKVGTPTPQGRTIELREFPCRLETITMPARPDGAP